MGFVISERKKLQSDNYKSEVDFMRRELNTLILAKQKSTVAIAMSLSNDKNLIKALSKKEIPEGYYNDLILKLGEDTLYKNIWIQILDNDLNSIYRSWDSEKRDRKKDFREDLSQAVKLKKPIYSISAGIYDMSIRAIVPLFENEKNIGVIEIISRFNSISKELKKFDIDSVVVLKKEHNKHLKKPFSNIFIDEYYVANLDAKDVLREYLKKDGIENYFNSSYKIKDNHIIVSNKLEDINSKTLGYYIMFKSMDTLANKNLDFFMFKWFTFSALGVMLIATIIGNIIYFRSKKQKKYYKNIIDSSSNIVVVVDKSNIIDVNKTFFKYFSRYKTLEEFKKEHKSISDFFAEEEGCMSKNINGLSWLDYIINNPQDNQIKIIYDEKEYYFSVGVSLISQEDGHYSAIFSDITKEKLYQKELEYTNITDSLTKIKNRYYYNEQIKKESISSNRYSYPLSLIILDIDYFKKINDQQGHDVGDKVLVEYAKLISSSLREGDIFCRIGGEEFALILPHTNKNSAHKLAEKLRLIIEEHREIVPITMSFGVTQYINKEDLEYTFKRADEALYEAKNSGRNRVVLK